MKYFYILSCLIFFSSCNNKDNASGKLIALFNGDPWEAKGEAVRNEPLDIGIVFRFQVHKDGILREVLYFFKVPYIEGSYSLSPEADIRKDDGLIGSNYYTRSFDGDVLDGVYNLLPDTNNTIELTNVDEKNNIINGTFSAIFIKERGSGVDTVRLENGEFEVELKD